MSITFIVEQEICRGQRLVGVRNCNKLHRIKNSLACCSCITFELCLKKLGALFSIFSFLASDGEELAKIQKVKVIRNDQREGKHIDPPSLSTSCDVTRINALPQTLCVEVHEIAIERIR